MAANKDRPIQPTSGSPQREAAKPAAEKWSEHEHVAGPVHAQARKLLDEAGSPDLAKQAVESAAADPVLGNSKQDALAQQCGFPSYLALFEASTLVASVEGKNWHLTALPKGIWMTWNDVDLVAEGTFQTPEEARENVPRQMPVTPS